MKHKKSIYQIVLICGFVFYICFLVWNILFKYVSPLQLFSEGRYYSRSLNLIPYSDLLIGHYYNRLDLWGNIILFMPAGVFLKLWKPTWKLPRIILAAMSLSLFFEVFQYVFAIGASDISDIISNTLGGTLGAAAYLLLVKVVKDSAKAEKIISILCGTAAIGVAGLCILLILFN